MKVQLIAAQIEVAPNTFTVVVLGAFPIALRTAAGAFPLKAHIDSFTLVIKLGLRDVPRVFHAQQTSEQLGISHLIPLRRIPDFLLATHSNS